MISEGLKDSYKSNKLTFLIIILQFTAALIFFNLSINGIFKINSNNISFYNKTDKGYYGLIDNYIGDKEVAFSNEPDKLSRLKYFWELLIENENFRYMEISQQPLYVKDFQGSEVFFNGYEYNKRKKAVLLEGSYYTLVNSVQINKTVINDFNFNLEKGQMFVSTDYLYDQDTPIPILLGYEYLGTYNIGDEIEVDYLQLKAKAKIKGFLTQDTYIIKGDNIIYLDRYIVFPSIIFDNTPSDYLSKEIQYRHYLNKVNGIIVSNQFSANELQSTVNSLSNQAHLDDFKVNGASNSALDILALQTSEFVLLTLIISILILIFATISLILSVCNKIKRNSKNYAIHLLNGATVTDIKKAIIFEILFYIFSANILAFILSYNILGYLYYSYYLLLLSVIVNCLALLVPFKVIREINISKSLREK